MEQQVNTAITCVTKEQIRVRGYDLGELIGRASFGETAFLLLTSREATRAESRMLEAILIACLDHGVDAPSTHVARTTASCGVPVQAAISAGILAIGENHGGAGEQCARILQEAVQAQPEMELGTLARGIVEAAKEAGRRLPGFGHRQHDPDPRAVALMAKAQELKVAGKYLALALEIQEELSARSGRSLPLNVDGAIAALISDMGMDWRFGKSLFIIGRTVGLAAQVHEEMTCGKPLKFARPVHAEYTGPAPRAWNPEE